MINPMDLTGKRILVTGASGGIGEETAIQLSRLGARVVISGRNDEKLKELYGRLEGTGHHIHPMDLNEVDRIESSIKNLVSEHGPFYGFAHCAGIAPMRPLKMTRTENMIQVMNANLFSFIEIVRCITKKGCFENEGSIVAVSSTASIQGKQSKIAYSASKAALDGAVRCLVCDLKKKKIRKGSSVVLIESISGVFVGTKGDVFRERFEHFT